MSAGRPNQMGLLYAIAFYNSHKTTPTWSTSSILDNSFFTKLREVPLPVLYNQHQAILLIKQNNSGGQITAQK